MSDSQPPAVSVRRRAAVYRALHLDPQWVSSEVLTAAIGTLRSIALPDVHSGEQAAERARESVARIERAVEAKLREHGIEVIDDEA